MRRHLRAHPHQSGFTLIEIIVVIAILALVGSLVLTRQPWRSASLDTDTTLRALMNGMRLARSRAIAQDREVAVVTAPGGFSIDGAAPRTLAPNQALSPSRVVFTPDGGSTGGMVLLVRGPAADRRGRKLADRTPPGSRNRQPVTSFRQTTVIARGLNSDEQRHSHSNITGVPDKRHIRLDPPPPRCDYLAPSPALSHSRLAIRPYPADRP